MQGSETPFDNEQAQRLASITEMAEALATQARSLNNEGAHLTIVQADRLIERSEEIYNVMDDLRTAAVEAAMSEPEPEEEEDEEEDWDE